MNFPKKLVLAGLAVTLVLVPACAHHRHGGGRKTTSKCGVAPCGQGPGAGHHYGQMDREFQVYIYTDLSDSTQCYADIDIATLWTKTKKNSGQPVHQTVTWFSDDGKDYTIDFRPDPKYPDKRGSPFQPPPSQPPTDLFYIPPGGSVPSQDLKPDSTGYYAFAIWAGKNVDQGKPCKDAGDPGYRVSP